MARHMLLKNNQLSGSYANSTSPESLLFSHNRMSFGVLFTPRARLKTKAQMLDNRMRFFSVCLK